MCDCAEGDPAVIYSGVRNDDINYEQIVITDKKEKSKTRGTAALLCLHPSLLQPDWGCGLAGLGFTMLVMLASSN